MERPEIGRCDSQRLSATLIEDRKLKGSSMVPKCDRMERPPHQQ